MRYYDVSGTTVIPLTPINPYSALAIPAYRRAVSFLANNMASFPRSVRLNGAKPTNAHPLDKLLRRRPNQLQNPTIFWRTLFLHAVHAGNGYAKITRDAIGRPIAFNNLMPDDIRPFRYDPLDGSGIAQWYLHWPTKTAIPCDDMIHLSSLSFDGQAGMDPIALHEGAFQRAATLERYQTLFLQKGSVVRGAVEIPGSLTEDQMRTFRAVLKTFRGPDSEDDLLILTDSAKLNNATITPEESQLVEQSQEATKQIAQMTDVPPEFLYELSEAKYNSSVEASGQSVVRYTFRPWIKLTEDELTAKLLTEAEQDQGYTIGLNPDALLRGDTKTIVETVTSTVTAGIRTRNEGRELLDLPPNTDPDSDKLKTLGDTSPPKATAAA